ncbi:hypothetical protein EV672_101697 [Aquabacterium commune]|uniref:4-amino-4-deoxy-L-arabinose transferase-like glycosyltransferase n=1 Tax=Aquabacterium commune TaxID=70586 RepID=A0A4R6RQJ9_9BURK|nr:hypothetical protein [Aquabacterium commune]TDP88545.1 hypothetical protein EV672_101697 [Aquabacterium commune]
MTHRALLAKFKGPLLALSLLWVAGWLWFTWGYWEDDAYIHLEYARNFHDGRGFMFNGLVSNGDTSPLWVVLLAAALGTGLAWLVAGKVLTILCAAFTMIMLWRFASRLREDAELDANSLPAWMLLIFVASPYFCYWAFSGMEAVGAAGWLMMQSMLLMPRRASLGTLMAAALSIGLGPVIRPEMVLMFAAGGPFLLYQWWQVTQGMSAARRGAVFLTAAVLLALPLAVWSAYALQAFGYVMPNTNAAKRAAPDSSVVLRMLNVFGLGFPGVLLALAGLAAALGVPALRAATAGTPSRTRMLLGIPASAAPMAAWLALVTLFYVFNQTYVQTRYALVMAPGLTCLLWVLALRHMRSGLVNALSVTTVALCVAGSLWMARPHLRNKMEVISAIDQMARHIQATVPAGQGIAVYSIGQYGFQLRQHPLIDIGGITRPEASKYLFEGGDKMLAWAKREGARYYISGESPEPGATLLYETQGRVTGWYFQTGAYDAPAMHRLWLLPATAP